MDLTTPLQLIEQLDPDIIRGELARLSQQEDALRVLLRAALARRRTEQERAERQEVARAS